MANPTSNYGFVLPTSSDLVTDLPADFDVALQGVDTRLKALNPATTLGDLNYASATANTNTRLSIGTTGQVLTVSGGVPVWGAVSGGGKVLQVIYGSTVTSVTNSSGSYSDTTLTATITPTSATSRVLVLVDQNGCSKTVTNANTSLTLKLQRGATDLAFLADGALATGTTLKLTSFNYSISLVDSPASTSALTYKTVFMEGNALSSVSVQSDGSRSTIVLLEIGE
jgi:hypothetical protein